MSDESNKSRLSEEEVRMIAKEVVKQMFQAIDISIGTSIRKRILWLVAAAVVVAGIALHLIEVDFPGK